MIANLYSAVELCSLVARRAKARRVALRLRQIDIAESAGVTISTVKRFERDGRVGFEVVAAIAAALDAAAGMTELFPAPEIRSIDDLIRANVRVDRVRRIRS